MRFTIERGRSCYLQDRSPSRLFAASAWPWPRSTPWLTVPAAATAASDRARAGALTAAGFTASTDTAINTPGTAIHTMTDIGGTPPAMISVIAVGTDRTTISDIGNRVIGTSRRASVTMDTDRTMKVYGIDDGPPSSLTDR
ncbi:MAG: hypothetical protein ABSE22_20430 [Xanthobacteraceae bacterium]